jgi:hypothetical protein
MLAECARMLLRRWLWVIVALVVAVVAGAAAYVLVGPRQASTAEVLFLPSVNQPGDTPGVLTKTNPFRSLDSSLGVVAGVVQVSVTDDQTQASLIQAGYRATYTVGPNLAENAGPSLLVKVEDKSGPMAQATLGAVLKQMDATLARIQADRKVPAGQFITAMVVTSLPHPSPDRKTQIQLAVVAGIVVFLLLIVLILLLERRRTRPERVAAGASPDDRWGDHANGRDAKAAIPPAPVGTGRRPIRRKTKVETPPLTHVADGGAPEQTRNGHDPSGLTNRPSSRPTT